MKGPRFLFRTPHGTVWTSRAEAVRDCVKLVPTNEGAARVTVVHDEEAAAEIVRYEKSKFPRCLEVQPLTRPRKRRDAKARGYK